MCLGARRAELHSNKPAGGPVEAEHASSHLHNLAFHASVLPLLVAGPAIGQGARRLVEGVFIQEARVATIAA